MESFRKKYFNTIMGARSMAQKYANEDMFTWHIYCWNDRGPFYVIMPAHVKPYTAIDKFVAKVEPNA